MNRVTRVGLAVAVFLGLHLVVAFWEGTGAWGVDALQYYSFPASAIFGALTFLILLSSVRRRAIEIFERLSSPWDTGKGIGVLTGLLLMGGGTAFLVWPSAVHLLGDGYLLLRDLPALLPQNSWKGINAPLNLVLVKGLHQLGGPWWSTPEHAYRFLSGLSGMVYLILVPRACLAFGKTAVSRTVVLGLLITPGLLQIFFGYVENYATLLPFGLAYLIAGDLSARGRFSIWIPACLLGVMIPLHFVMVVFIPSFLAIVYTREKGEIKKALSGSFLGLVAVSSISFLILFLIDFNPGAYLRSMKGSHVLPLVGEPGFAHHYRLLSPLHFFDIANQYLLVAPAAVLLLAAFRRADWRISSPFLFSAALFPLLFILIANPEVGAFRDWDAFAFAGLPMTVWMGASLSGRLKSKTDLAHIGLLVCAAAGLHTALWIGLNSDESMAVTRFKNQLIQSTLSPNARSYGWETLGIYQRGKGQRDEALEAYKHALEANSSHPRHWLSAGNLLRELGDKTEALKYFERAITLDSTFTEVYSNMANIYSEKGEHEKAIQFLEKSIALNPKYAEVYSNMGNVHYRKGNYQKAVEYYFEAMRLKPRSADFHYNLGNAYQALGDYGEAFKSFDRATRLKPGFRRAENKIAGVLFEQGKFEAAIRKLQQIVVSNPRDAKAYSDLGSASYRLNQFGKAIDYYEKAILLRPDLPDPHYNVGNAHFAQGDYASAARAYQKAIGLKEDYAEAHSNLGSVYGKLKEHEKGIDSYQTAIRFQPNFPGAYYGLGATYAALGRRQEAAFCFRKVLELDPGYSKGAAIRKWLGKE